jgi:hypothetical protein
MTSEVHPPALLLGSPRSGTTWLAKIIDSHPDVLYRHEPDSINVRPDIPFVPEADVAGEYLDACRDYLNLLCSERASKSSGSQPMFDKHYRGAVAASMHRMLVLSVKAGERVPGLGSAVAGWQVPDLVSSGRTPLVFIKSVSSLCRARMFSLARPDIRILHILRHPCAYVASTMRGKQLGLLSDDAYIETLAAMPESAAHDLTLDRLRSMPREQQLAARWMLQNEKVMAEMRDSQNYRRVIYEDLCAEPEATAGELFQFLGLEMVDQCRSFIRQSSGGKSAEVRYFDVRRDSRAAASRWASELTTGQIDGIREVVADSEAGRLYFAG